MLDDKLAGILEYLRLLAERQNWLVQRVGAAGAELIGRELREAVADLTNNGCSPGLRVFMENKSIGEDWEAELFLVAHCLSRYSYQFAIASWHRGEALPVLRNSVRQRLQVFSWLVGGPEKLWALLEAGMKGALWSHDFGALAQACLDRRR